MTDDKVFMITDLDNDFNSGTLDTYLKNTKQGIANLQELSQCKNKVQQEIGRLRKSRDKSRREYVREVGRREKEGFLGVLNEGQEVFGVEEMRIIVDSWSNELGT